MVKAEDPAANLEGPDEHCPVLMGLCLFPTTTSRITTMGPQCEDGYTKIANELLEELCKVRVPGESMQIFLVILRKTYGYGKKADNIALSQFVSATGIGKTHVSRALTKLVNMNIIVTQKGNANGITYGVNKHYATWQQLPKKVTLPKMVTKVTQNGNSVTQNGNKGYPKRVPQKKERNLSKEKKEIGLLEICKVWKAFVEMRKMIKKPMTQYAMELRVKELFNLMAQGQDVIAVINQSISSNYQDFYPVKEKTNDRTGTVGSPVKAGIKKGIVDANGAGTNFLE